MKINETKDFLELTITEQDSSLKFLNIFLFGYSFLSILFFYGFVNSLIHLNWFFTIVGGTMLYFAIKELIKVLKFTSMPKLLFTKSKLNIEYIKFGKTLTKKSVNWKDIISYDSQNISSAESPININQIQIKIKEGEIIIGRALKKEHVQVIKEKMKYWLEQSIHGK